MAAFSLGAGLNTFTLHSVRSESKRAGYWGRNGDTIWHQAAELRVCSGSISLAFLLKATARLRSFEKQLQEIKSLI